MSVGVDDAVAVDATEVAGGAAPGGILVVLARGKSAGTAEDTATTSVVDLRAVVTQPLASIPTSRIARAVLTACA
jgi:hypothetical protein